MNAPSIEIAKTTSIRTAARVLEQEAASRFLWDECGVRCAPMTLKRMRSAGGGPKFYRGFGRRIFYEPGPLKAWGDAQRSPLVSSTSELPSKAA
jgi:hypothetical protein